MRLSSRWEDADAIYQRWKANPVEILGEVIDIGATWD